LVARIVIDTSVLISALIGKKGPAGEVLRQCLLGEDETRALLDSYYGVCHWVPVYYLLRPGLRDENDNFWIELAMAGSSNLIITNSTKDLARAELRFYGLKIVTPEKLLRGKYLWLL